MTLSISSAEYQLLRQASDCDRHRNLILEEFETLKTEPACIGQIGYTRCVDLMPGIQLDLVNWKCDRSLIIETPIHEHEIQFLIYLSGVSSYQEVYPDLGAKRGYLSGSGISRAYRVRYSQG